MALNVGRSSSSSDAMLEPFHVSVTVSVVSDSTAFPNIVPETKLKACIAREGGSQSDSLFHSSECASFPRADT